MALLFADCTKYGYVKFSELILSQAYGSEACSSIKKIVHKNPNPIDFHLIIPELEI